VALEREKNKGEEMKGSPLFCWERYKKRALESVVKHPEKKNNIYLPIYWKISLEAVVIF
jgi:hypothetical protein